MTSKTIRIATRKSALALWQAEFVKAKLEAFHPDVSVELVPMSTKGDRILDTPLAKVGGKGLFVKELETAMLEDRADIAVHSMKDVPVDFPEGLVLHTICEREDPRDAFVSNQFNCLNDLPQNSVVGTSSLRRQCQLRELRPDLQIKDFRNHETYTILDKYKNYLETADGPMDIMQIPKFSQSNNMSSKRGEFLKSHRELYRRYDHQMF